MVLNFKGVAHPPPSRSGRGNHADLSAAEISTTNMGMGNGTQLLMEHDHGDHVGTVLASWEGADGSLRVQGIVSDPTAAASVRSGETRGLSLGTSVHSLVGSNGSKDRLMATQDELSLCAVPRRGGCYITDIDGTSVRSTHNFSGKPKGATSPLTPHKTNLGTYHQCHPGQSSRYARNRSRATAA